MKSVVIRWGRSLLNALSPRYCLICGRRLELCESLFCVGCYFQLPIADMQPLGENVIWRRLWGGGVDVVRGCAFMYYRPQSKISNVFFDFKYNHHPQTAVLMGRIMAQHLKAKGFFEGIDYLIPTPLSKLREEQRGYNQSERLAYGVSLETGICMDDKSVTRAVDKSSQTNYSGEERQKNVQGIFRVQNAERFAHCHLLLIDDVMTTGSTLRALASVFKGIEDVKISVAVLALAESGMKHVFPTHVRE